MSDNNARLMSRRRFMEHVAVAAAGLTTGTRGMQFPMAASAGTVGYHIAPTAATLRLSAEQWLPPTPSAESMRELAVVAMEAARAAGAEFADIRIGVYRGLSVEPASAPWVDVSAGYGIRAMVGGTWSFERGSDFSIDAVTTVARRAVTGAKQYSALNARLATAARTAGAHRMPPPWADTPAVTGEWHAPVAIDPFAVPLNEHYRADATRTDAVAPGKRNSRVDAGYGWDSITRVFASSAGSLITQTRTIGGCQWRGAADLPGIAVTGIEIDAPEMTPFLLGGFELMHDLERISRAAVSAADAWAYDKLPMRPFTDVGRFPVVFDGSSVGGIVSGTLNPALDGDRAFGLERDTAGTSFLTPAEEILDATTAPFSPLLSFYADRRAPSPLAARWDDDGVAIAPYPLIDHGRVVGYHTTRATAPYLSGWASRHGQTSQSRGSCTALRADDLPAGGFGHTFVAPATTQASVHDLMREVTHGFYVLKGGADASPGLTGALFRSNHLMLEIRKGIPVARTVFSAHLDLKTLLGKKLIALGDSNTVRMRWEFSQKGMPWRYTQSVVDAPAMLCKDIDIVGAMATP